MINVRYLDQHHFAGSGSKAFLVKMDPNPDMTPDPHTTNYNGLFGFTWKFFFLIPDKNELRQ